MGAIDQLKLVATDQRWFAFYLQRFVKSPEWRKSLSERVARLAGRAMASKSKTASDEAIEASIDAGQDVPISNAHLKEALSEVRPTTLEWLTTARNYARYANEGGQYDEVLDFLKDHGK